MKPLARIVSLVFLLLHFSAATNAAVLTSLTNPANGHLYHLLTTNSWTASQAEAVSLGGNLVTINDAAENNWVYSNFSSFGGANRSLWIGLNDQAQEGTFVWVSGQTSPYTNWRPGEPSSSSSTEDFVHLGPPDFSPGQWNDLDDFSTFFPNLNGVVEVELTNVPPFNLMGPVSKTVAVGSNALFTVSANGTLPFQYQWFFNEGLLAGATNSTLSITNAQLTNAGLYRVTVMNSFGSTNSTNAVLTVLTPVSITTQPQGGTVVVGTNFTFNVSVAGDAPVYQWRKNGANIAGATNSSLILTNIQFTNAGTYSVSVTNAVSATVSSNAILSVVSFPVITTQPQSQVVLVGANVTFSVGVNEVLPALGSGTLRLWLKADSGIVADSLGRVSQWQDQSARTNHASQANTNRQPTFVGAGFNGRPVVRFDGLQDATNGDFLFGSGDVGLTTGFTSFLVYSRTNRPGLEEIPTLVGVPGTGGASRAFSITNNEMRFSTWVTHYGSGFFVPPSTYRIGTERLNASRTLIEFFDTNGTNDFTTSRATSSLLTPGSGYYIGGLSSSLRHFQGDIAEVIYYQGTLTEPDRQAVDAYLRGKYFPAPGAGATTVYQWLFNGTNIVGATNSFLTLSNVQSTNAGNYSVTVSNLAGSATSSNALLTVNIPPFITTHPQTQSANAGGMATLNVVAGGTPPLSFQWFKDNAPRTGATNSSLSLVDLAPFDSGTYFAIVTSPFGVATSSIAALSVNVSTIRASDVSTFSASDFVLPVELAALGNENALSFSLSFDPSVLSFKSVSLGSGAGGATLIATTSGTSAGRLGVFVGFSSYETFLTGTQQVLNVAFKVAPITNSTVTSVTFGNDPTYREVSDIFVNTLWSAFVPGAISISAVDFEGDTSPRGNGNRILSATDWIQVGRFAAGLDMVSDGAEFQRADCAPRATSGNGSVTIIDWVQAGRYAFGADPISPAGGPLVPGAPPVPLISSSENRFVTLEATQTGQTNLISVRLASQGNENALGLSLNYNPAILSFVSASVGGNASGAILNVNSNQTGKIGLALALATGSHFSVGTQEVIKLLFVTTASAAGATTLSFTDTPVFREVSGAMANALPASYSEDLTLEFSLPTLTIFKSDQQVILSWPSPSAGFVLQGTPAVGATWTDLTNNVMTNGLFIRAILPIAEQQQLFRLRQP